MIVTGTVTKAAFIHGDGTLEFECRVLVSDLEHALKRQSSDYRGRGVSICIDVPDPKPNPKHATHGDETVQLPDAVSPAGDAAETGAPVTPTETGEE